MIAKKLTIGAQDGLHATVNASSILSILSLALKKGTEVEIKADGPDEDKALAEVIRFLESL